ncbi:MAG: DNA methyltransferase [Methanolobus sp.]|nr:DNA methyltransferase [Methanolobus sp.]
MMISDVKTKLITEYQKLDEDFNTHTDSSYQYLVNFSQTKNEPISRWFYYVEGYSPELVKKILDHIDKNDNNCVVFDPFAGSGTTLLSSKIMGMKSIGFELNPFSAFIIKTKTQNYTNLDIENVRNFKIPSFVPINDVYDKYELRIIKNLFNETTLIKIELLKKKIFETTSGKSRDLLFLALLSILEGVSNYRKGGNGLKKKKIQKDFDVFEEFDIKRKLIIDDLKDVKHGMEPTLINDSCLNMLNYEIGTFDVSIFSPPYANCFDPFEVYKIELWIGEFVKSYSELRNKRKQALTSNLNANVKKEITSHHQTQILEDIIDYLNGQKLWDKRIPKMIDTYFFEMKHLLEMIYSKTKVGGYCIIVVGNSAYGHLAIPTDIILAQLGKEVGFTVSEIIVARKNETSSQQYDKIGGFIEYIRESLVVLKK